MGWKKLAIATSAGLIYLTAYCLAVEPIVKIDRVRADHVAFAGFTLNKGGDFTVKGVGLLGRQTEDFVAYGWLLDSSTRKPVWVMDRRNTNRKNREGLRAADDNITLKPGKYELYYYAGSNFNGEININNKNLFEFFGNLFEGRLSDDIEEYLDEFNIAIYPAKINYTEFSTFAPDGLFPDALIQFNKVGDSKYLQQGFKLDRPSALHIYGLCEYPSGSRNPIDYGWIINADTRDKVWQMDRWNTDPAGGGRKNRVVDQEINLDKGSYILIYVTDDSHSWDDFNVMPPYDPMNWGVAILPAPQTDKNAFHLFVPKGRGDALVAMNRAGNDASLSEAFKLDREMSLRILCLGEYAGEFADYGWIEEAPSGKTVWEMTYRNTEFAGGAAKNRMFDGTVNLPKGSYIAHYISDDSHAFPHWNDSPPYEPEAWGLSIYPGNDFDKAKFHRVNEAQLQQNTDILVKMVSLGDNVRKRAKFTLERQYRIHIYAVGEGDSDQMFDFGWIINDKTDKTVWEMTWRNTEPAGGAMKNRMFDDSIILDAGTYEVYFVTDGSHSFNDWNSARPRDPASWGITVRLDKN